MNKVTLELTVDQVKGLIQANYGLQNTYKSIIKLHPADNAEEKKKLAFHKRIENKLFESIGL